MRVYFLYWYGERISLEALAEIPKWIKNFGKESTFKFITYCACQMGIIAWAIAVIIDMIIVIFLLLLLLRKK